MSDPRNFQKYIAEFSMMLLATDTTENERILIRSILCLLSALSLPARSVGWIDVAIHELGKFMPYGK
jgi:hypothetical protein